MHTKKTITILFHAFIVWALCAAVMGIGWAITTEQNAFIIYATAAPIIATLVSLNYFKKYHYTSPLQPGLIFVVVPAALDFLIVALLILRNMDMFTSPGSLLGTWIPLTLIFASTCLTGLVVNRGLLGQRSQA